MHLVYGTVSQAPFISWALSVLVVGPPARGFSDLALLHTTVTVLAFGAKHQRTEREKHAMGVWPTLFEASAPPIQVGTSPSPRQVRLGGGAQENREGESPRDFCTFSEN